MPGVPCAWRDIKDAALASDVLPRELDRFARGRAKSAGSLITEPTPSHQTENRLPDVIRPLRPHLALPRYRHVIRRRATAVHGYR